MKFSKQRLSVCCSHEARLVTIRTLMVMLTATAGLMRSVMVASVIDEKKRSSKNKTRNPAIAEGPRDAGVPVEIW